MRKQLGKINDQRLRFRATVSRFGTKTNYHGFPEPTILLTDIVRLDTDELLTDHLWFPVGKRFGSISLKPGDVIEFDARVGSYKKGYVNHSQGIDERTTDYKLRIPSKIVKVSASTVSHAA